MFSKPARRLATTREGKLDEPPSRLLILACSSTKKRSRRLLRAIDRYDGPVFRTLRIFWKEGGETPRAKDVYILSAKFGLIPGTRRIPYYDVAMNRKRASAMSQTAARALKSVVRSGSFVDGLAVMGSRYRQALQLEDCWPFMTAKGGIGYQLGSLKRWLREFGVSDDSTNSTHLRKKAKLTIPS